VQIQDDPTSITLLAKLKSELTDEWNAAWGRFYNQYVPLILKWATRWNLQPVDRDEIAAAVMLKLSKHMERFEYDPSQSFRGWLKQVVSNEIKAYYNNHLSKLHRTEQSIDLGLQNLAVAADTAADDLSSQFLQSRESLQQALHQAKQSVSQVAWESFERTCLKEESAMDVANDLGVSILSVYKHKSRTLQVIRDLATAIHAKD
jgi:RNA polymerase sigma factor (sigma-70 family)